ncbi:phosphoserine phosphatase [Motilibacter peucedani]|uniref:phosphoserine phosphatase n=1 Tax=Motilibacter peucedani TaxID=598650 RepID=A0A420XK21_9ACTN|nr:phosphoserine phosphatase SerB [Motilibacter peucedani]RKS68039.1 phosphoserine phosphatase [Motilibacter peucedani]
MAPTRTLLVTLTGADRPGVTSRLFAAFAGADVAVLDVEQVVVRGRLVLGVLLEGADLASLERAARSAGDGLGMEVETLPGAAEPEQRASRSLVTVLGRPLTPAALAAVTGRIADAGANIDRIVRIARYPVTAVEMEVSGTDTADLRLVLAREAAQQRVDVAVQRAGLHRRGKRLVVMDVDSTLIQGEVIEMLAEHAGVADEVARVTESAMRGELDFAESLHARVALLAGLPESVFDDVRRSVVLTPGARTLVRTLKRLDHRVAVVSGGFTQVVQPLADELELDYAAANTLEVVGGTLTGRIVGDVVDRAGKAAALRRFAADCDVPLGQTVAIGDGANDLDMLGAAGLGVAFNAKPVVRAAAHTAVTVPYLDAVLFLLGIPREEVEEADALDG